MTTGVVPIIDLTPFRTGTAADRQAVARQVGAACEQIGFFTIIGHGIPEELIAEIGVERIRAKSQRQTRRMMDQALEAGFTLRNPLDDQWRGGTVCIDFPGSGEVSQALNATGYLNDHRPGAGIRVSPHLYSTDEECDRMMAELIRLERALPR